RYGEKSRDNVEISKSVLGIWGRSTGELHWLEFRLRYKGHRGPSEDSHNIRGVVLPMGEHFYFLGIDDGMQGAPCLMICWISDLSIEMNKITGTLLRVNTRSTISATRTASLRIKEANTNLSVDLLFKKHEDDAENFAQGDPKFDDIKSIHDD